MALYVKFRNSRREEDFDRFKAAIKFFNILRDNIKFGELKTYLYIGDANDNTLEYRLQFWNFRDIL